jgi:hypothetical protein
MERTTTKYKAHKALNFLFVFLVASAALMGQEDVNTVFLVKPHRKSSSLMINHEGKIVKEFSPEAQILVLENGQSNMLSMLYGTNFSLHNFEEGLLPVKIEDEWKLYDITGKATLTFDKKYTYIGYPTKGLYFARKVNESNPRENTGVFLDAGGKEMLDGKKIWRTTLFIGNTAYARDENEKGEWIRLNKNTLTFTPISAALADRCYSITSKAMPYFEVMQHKKQGYGSILIDSTGNIVFDPETLTGVKGLSFVALHKNLAVFQKDGKFYFFRELKTWIKHNAPIKSVDGLSDQLIFVNRWSSEPALYDYNLEPFTLPLETHQVFNAKKLDDQYLGGYVWDSISQKKEYRIYDSNTLQLLGKTESPVGDVIANKWLEVERVEDFDKKLRGIFRFDNTQVFQLPTTHKLFKGITSTKAYPAADIRHLEVSDNEDLSRLKEFKNLQSLQFFDFNFTSLPPVIKKLKSIKHLDIMLCRSLTSLPLWLKDLPSLEILEIHDCKRIRNIEPVLMQLPRLKQVTTVNYDFDETFSQKMQQPGARFHLNAIYGTSMDEGPVLEDNRN